MFLTSRFKQSPLSTGPVTLLKELDRLLIAAGWTREGTDPNSLNDSLETASPMQTWQAYKFCYRHPTANESLFFRANWEFARTPANAINTAIGFAFAPIKSFNAAFDGSTFPSAYATVQYAQTGWVGQDCHFILGAGPDGFYLQQLAGERPGGFVVEKHASGEWSFHIMENQWRYFNIANQTPSVQARMPEAILSTTLSNYGNWYSDPTPQGAVCVVDTAHNQPNWKGQLSYMQLSYMRDLANSQVVLESKGALMKGPYFYVAGGNLLSSNLFRLYHLPYSTMQGTEGGVTKGFAKHLAGGSFQSTVAWRNL